MVMAVIFQESRVGIWTESMYFRDRKPKEFMILILFYRAKYLRQTLVFADFLTPEFNALFNKHLKNVSGKLKIKQTYEEGSIMDVIPQVQQSFTRIDAPSLKAINDTRYKYFIEKVKFT